MNPNEWFGVELYTASNDAIPPTDSPTPVPNSTEEYQQLQSELHWGCRIAGVKCPANLDIDLDFKGLFEPWYLQVHLVHMGLSVYALVLLAAVNLTLLVAVAMAGPIGRAPYLGQLLLLLVAVPMSFGFAEVIVLWLVPDRIPIDQQWGVYAIFWINLATLIYLILLAIREKAASSRDKPDVVNGA